MDGKSAVPETQEDDHQIPPATDTHTPPATATLPAERNKCRIRVGMVSAEAAWDPKNSLREPKRTSDASSSHTRLDRARRQSAVGDKEPRERKRQGQSNEYQASGRQRQPQQKKPAVVREVRLAPRVNSATAVAAALLLTDGRVWWVADLQVGTWEEVTVSASGAEATVDGVAIEGCLSSPGASTITVVRLPGNAHAESRKTGRNDGRETFVAGTKVGGDCGSGRGLAIVVGRDDGWLFLLTQRRPPPTDVEDSSAESAYCRGRGKEQPSQQASYPPRPWRIGAAWKGHRSRVTAIWAIGDAAQSEGSLHASAGGSRGFTAALDTSRLCVSTRRGERGGGEFCGALASAGGDGTVAWWEWACADQDGDVLHGDIFSSSFGEVATRAPRLRMVSCACCVSRHAIVQFRVDLACGTISCCTRCLHGALRVPVLRFERGLSG